MEEELYKCECPIEIKPLAEWVAEEDPDGLCRPCMIEPTSQWYQDILRENEYGGLADELAELENNKASPEEICAKLDNIKDTVPSSLNERLKDFDCALQSYQIEQPGEQSDE